MILIISFISPFEINKVNPFPPLTTPFPFIFLSHLYTVFESVLLLKIIQVVILHLESFSYLF